MKPRHVLLTAPFLRLFCPLAALIVATVLLIAGLCHLPQGTLENSLEPMRDVPLPAIVAALVLLLALLAWIILRFQANGTHEAELNSMLKAYFERSTIGMATLSAERKWLAVNPALCAMLGYSEAELLQKTWDELTFPDDLANSTALFERALRGEIEAYTLEKRYLRRDGQALEVSVAAQVIRRKDGRVGCIVGLIEDLSARKHVLQELAENQATLRSLSDNLPQSYLYQYSITPEGRPIFLYLSSGVARIHGVDPQTALEHPESIFASTDPDDVPRLQAAVANSAANMSTLLETIHIRRGDGRWGWLQLRSLPRRTASGELIWDGVATDVTEQYERELAVRHINHRFEILLDLPRKAESLDETAFMQYALEQAELVTDSQIAFIHLVNEDQESIELITWSSRTLKDYCTAAHDPHYPISQAGIWAEAARQKRPIVFNDYENAENKRGLPEGHSVLTRLISVPVIEGGKVRMMAGVGNKADDYLQADVESLQLIANTVWRLVSKSKSEQALLIASKVVNASSVVCFRWRAETNWPVNYVSENVLQWGYEVADLLAGKPSFAEMVHPDDLNRVMQEVNDFTALGRSQFFQEYRIVTRNGDVRWVVDETVVQRRADGSPEFYDGVLSDISERKRAELGIQRVLAEQRVLNKKLEEAHNQLLQSEKMASIGQLAAGVAHELNNPIGFVHSNLGTLETYLRDLMILIDAYDKALSEAGESAATRSIEQIRQERDFDYVRKDIFELIGESRDGLDRLRRIVQNLKTFSRVGSDDWSYADLNQGIESTLNIVWNELKYKCTVTKSLGELPPVYCLISQLNQVFMNLLVNAAQAIEEKGEITIRSGRLNDDEVMVEIIDTGKGIAPEIQTRIFDPFFTTKPVGKGTGLGLSISYGIIEAHHGRIEFDSQPGKGTHFRVRLPIEQPRKTANESTGNGKPA